MLMMKAALACNKAAPSTMGTLISSGMMALAKTAKGKSELSDAEVVAVPRQFAEAIMQRGKAKPGDKTILDALVPMADAVEAEFAKNGDLKTAYSAGAKAADEGAKATSGMLAAAGRAKWLGERARENPDGGAVLCAIIAKILNKSQTGGAAACFFAQREELWLSFLYWNFLIIQAAYAAILLFCTGEGINKRK